MSILGRLALLFVIVPLLELALLIQMGQLVGFWPTIALVVFTGLTGAWLTRMEGLRTIWRLRDDLENGRVPGQALMDGVAVLAGGALLLTPGILTDFVGFGLLFPGSRRIIQKRIMARLEDRIREGVLQVSTSAIHRLDRGPRESKSDNPVAVSRGVFECSPRGYSLSAS